MKKDLEYENLAKDIYQELLEADGLTVEVKHNVKVKGRSTHHQIDVYWEYSFADVKHRVAIECKYYNKTISLGKVRDFHAALMDIGNINGIMVTNMGYQKGAIEFATKNGINLKIIREPRDEDWNGRIRTLNTIINIVQPINVEINIDLDYDWCTINKLITDKAFTFQIKGRNDEMCIVDDKGNKLKNFLELEDALPCNGEQTQKIKHTYTFDNGFINTIEYDLLKVKAVHFTYDISVAKSEFTIDVKSLTKAIIKDIESGSIKFIKHKNY